MDGHRLDQNIAISGIPVGGINPEYLEKDYTLYIIIGAVLVLMLIIAVIVYIRKRKTNPHIYSQSMDAFDGTNAQQEKIVLV